MAEAKNYNRFLASLIERHVRPHQTILDFGAGAGTFALPLVRRGFDVTCVEPDEGLRARLREAGAPVVPSLSSVTHESVEFAYSFNVLEHIADDAEALRELSSKLKPGARLLIYVPAFEILFSAMDRRVGHHRRYRCDRLIDLLTKSGLRVTEAAYADSLGFLATLIYRLVGDNTGEVDRSALKAYDRWVFPLSRALDGAVSRWIGKNLVATAEKP